MTLVANNDEMNYDGVKRYRNEIFELIGARNDDKLVALHYVKVIPDDAKVVRDDYTGRRFATESALDAYRRVAPQADRSTIVRRTAGRPKGAKDSAPRKAAGTVVERSAS